jgi:hypothetical protein
MPRTPDRRPGELLEESIQFENLPPGNEPVAVGQVRFIDGKLLIKDAIGTYDARALHSLINFIDEGPANGFVSGATKTTTGTVFPTQNLWRRANNTKLLEKNITWTGVVPTTIEWKMYDSDGSTIIVTVTDTIEYSGIFETSRLREIE